MDFTVIDTDDLEPPKLETEPKEEIRLPPRQRDGLLVRPDPASSSLEECIETIRILEDEMNHWEKPDAGIVRELRVWRQHRLELEDRVSHEQAGLFFPSGMSRQEIIDELERLLEVAKSLPDQLYGLMSS